MCQNLWFFIPFVVLAFLFPFAADAWGAARRRRFLDRPDAMNLWRDTFRESSAGEIEAFLLLFVEAFGIDPEKRWVLRPDDRVIEIYSVRYIPHLTLDDNMEFETLADRLQEAYQLDMQPHWEEDLTLGRVFGLTRAIHH